MKVISWNLNSRTNKEVLESQCAYLKDSDFDVITLQEVTITSQKYFENYFGKEFRGFFRYPLTYKTLYVMNSSSAQ